jgi:hypothetical protein
MTKYAALGGYLREQKVSAIPMTFAEIERVIGGKLPHSQRYPAWWSNNPSNNVMTRVWLDAGFHTEQVDTVSKKLVFRRMNPPMPAAPAAVMPSGGMAEEGRSFRHAPRTGKHPLLGALKGILTIAPGTDLAQPALPDWAARFDEKWAGKLK